MNRFDVFKRWVWSLFVASTLAFALAGCDGSDGAPGQDGVDGQDGQDGVDAVPVSQAQLESCATCHGGAGDEHQAIYDPYTAPTVFTLAFDNVTSVTDGAGGFTFTLDFTITKNGAPFVAPVGMPPAVESTSFYVVQYDSGTGEFVKSGAGFFPSLDTSLAASNGDGTYTLTQTLSYDVSAFGGGAIVGRIADGRIDIEEGQYDPAEGKRVQMYEELASTSYPIGDIGTFTSLANVDGCVACHNAPYRKHGNIEAVVAGINDFVYCKACHSDDRTGGHEDWQYMVDEPFNWATGVASTADYSYRAVLMNDTHMSHAMEFPYPQSMQNCDTCHNGMLTQVLDDAKFTAETCLSCHPVQGVDAWPGETYAQSHRAPALDYLWTRGADLSFHDITSTCTGCHGAGVAGSFTAYHTGYDINITDDTGQRYADTYTVSIDQITMAGDLMTVNFSSSDPAIVPELLVSFYGWDSKHYIVGSHERDTNVAECGGSRPGCKMEYVPESSGGSANPLFTEDPASVPGAWMVTLDVSALQLTKTDDIPTQIANGDIKKAEVTITPEFNVGGTDVVLDAVSDTFDIGTSLIVDDYFKGANATVDTAKCNACHDALASTFHSESGRGGGMEVCKACHTTTFPGSHVEMASRSIDSYVHAIHSFQDFDVGDTFETYDPVFAKRYDLHVGHVLPHFTAKNCEACHVDGTFNVPDQSQSMPGVLATSDNPPTWYEIVGGLPVEDPSGRNISGSIPELVTGPASRACGACHRAHLINEDLAGDLASFNAHTDSFGTLAENDVDDSVLFGIIDDIMSLFE